MEPLKWQSAVSIRGNFLVPVYLSYMVSKHKTVLVFTISSGKLFHLLIVLTQNEIILNVFKALDFFSFFELPRV